MAGVVDELLLAVCGALLCVEHRVERRAELRLIFREPPRLGFLPAGHRRPQPAQLVVKVDPSTGIRVVLDARRADTSIASPIELDMEFADQGGEAPTPYEVLLNDAIRGDGTHFTRQDIVEQAWRIVQPLLERAPAIETYAPGSWGPPSAEQLLAGHGGWQRPWQRS